MSIHSDDLAVDRFALAMKRKLAESRAKGRSGWDDPNQCTIEHLAELLVSHTTKGNKGTFEDIANFAMMLHQRGSDPSVLLTVKKHGSWLSSDERLPNNGEYVLTYDTENHIYDILRFNGFYWTERAWPVGYAPTHWVSMPLPEAPTV